MIRYRILPVAEPTAERIPYADTWTAPKRIQRRRTKGWRMPPYAVYVGRPGHWGNDYEVGSCMNGWWESCSDHADHPKATPADVVEAFRRYRVRAMPWWFTVADLRGRDLVCWCPLTYADGTPYPCHADVLLELANR